MGILLAATLAGCFLLSLYFPWNQCEERLKASLNARIHPLHVDFLGLRLFWKDGPGLSVDALRLFAPASGTQAGHEALLAARRLTFRPALEDLFAREIAAHFVLEAPAMHAYRAEGGSPLVARIVSAIARGPGARKEGRTDDATDSSPSKSQTSLSELVVLPAGFTLTGASLQIRNGSLDGFPSFGISGVQASLRVESDLSFHAGLTNGALRWKGDEKGPRSLSAIVGAEIRGRAVTLNGSRVAGTLRLDQAVIAWRERTVEVPQRIQLSFRIEAQTDGTLSVLQILLTGPGLEIGMAGSTRLKESGPGAIEIRNLSAKVEGWQPFCALLSPETTLSGTLSLLAERIEIEPGRVTLPAFREGSFRPAQPEGLSYEGVRLHLTDGALSRADLGGGASASLAGLEMRIEQQGSGWTGTAEAANLEASKAGVFRVSGPVSVKARWSAGGAAPTANLVVDLTRGRLVCTNLLDKPPDASLQMGVRARILHDEIRVGKAFLSLGDTEWAIEGSVRDPARPLLKARLAPNIVSLEALTALSPALREYALGGRVEVKELALAGRLGAMRESALLEARVAGKDLTVRGVPVKGMYLQGVYGDQKLSINPVVIQPTTGMINAMFSADFSEAYRQEGLYQYSGTLQIDHVDLDELVRLASPGLAGKARGSADANLAFRGTGLAWPEAAANLEAKARIHLNHVALEEDDGGPDGNKEKGLAGKIGRALNEIDAEETVPQAEDLIGPEQERLLTANRAAGWFTMRGGSIHTDNLVAIYEGRLIEIQGSVDLAGRLKVEKGRLFTGGRMVPFRLDCRLGEERCRPRPDLEEMGKCAAAELTAGIRRLSEAEKGVYKDLMF